MIDNAMRITDGAWAVLMTAIAAIALAEGADWKYALVAAAIQGWSMVMTGRRE